MQPTMTHQNVPKQLPNPLRASAARAKATIDFAIVLMMCAVALPVALVAALLVKLTSPGPIFYMQTRVGSFGKPFKICKLRTMYHNCEAQSGAVWCSKNDRRVTWIGRILRATHLDELPQLWNILRGEMSLVGPRPERPEFVVQLEKLIPSYRGRLAVKPGVTGLAQIQLPSDTNLQSVRDKLALDLLYIRKRGFWLDLRLMFGTGLYLAGLSYVMVRRLMRLPTAAGIPELAAAVSMGHVPAAVSPSVGNAPMNFVEQQLAVFGAAAAPQAIDA